MIEIHVQPLRGSKLVRDYLDGAGDAPTHFNGHPQDPDSFRRKWGEVQARFGQPERARAADALRPTSPRAAERLARFVENGGAMVTTGQQAGLLTGPLFTIYKALTAVRLAETLERTLAIPVLPVFWIASEDHDWDEASHLYLPSAGPGATRLGLTRRPSVPVPMSDAVLDDDIRQLIAEFADHVEGYAHTQRYLELIRSCYQPGRTIGAAFRELIAVLLAPFDVLIADSADPAVKAASVPILTGALERAGELELMLAERGAGIEESGYELQVPLLEDVTNVFFHGHAGRERLQRRGRAVEAPGNRARIEREEIRAAVEREPERFSPNVLLRPVVESWIFPTLAYVAGPGEASYFAQASVLFQAFGISPPVVYPRLSATLVDEGARSRLERLGLSLEDASRPREVLVGGIARAGIPAELQSALRDVGETLTERYRALLEVAAELDPTLTGALGGRRNRSLIQLREAERDVLRAAKRREATKIGMLDRVLSLVQPGRAPQERVLNGMYFLCREGPELLHEIARAVPAPWRASASV